MDDLDRTYPGCGCWLVLLGLLLFTLLVYFGLRATLL